MDVAALSLSIDSSSVPKATSDLDKFSAASAKAGAAAGQPSGSMMKLAASVAAADAKLSMIIGTLDKIASASRSATAANDNNAASAARVGTAMAAADAHVVAYTQHLAAQVTAQRAASAALAAADAHVVAYRNHLASLPAAATQATASIYRVSQSASDSAGALRANTGNIAAQFQDLGVTAAMGMNPLIIGLQQGTQLSAAFAQSGGSMGAVLAGAFRQIASAQALMTIGLVAGLAALIQMVDWAKLAQTALNGFADVLVDVAPYAVAAAAALALIYAPAIIAGVAALTKGFIGLAASMLAIIPIPVLIVAGLATVVAAAVKFRDDLTRILGFDIVQAAQTGVNWIIGTFVGAYKGIVAAWGLLPAAIGDLTIRAANAALDGLSSLIRKSITMLNPVLALAKQFGFDAGNLVPDFGKIGNPYAGAAAEVGGIVKNAVLAERQVDFVGKGVAFVRDAAKSAAEYMREWARELGGVDSKTGKAGAGSDAAAAAPKADKWADLLVDADKQQRALDQAGAQMGVYGQALATLKREQELLNQAQDTGIKLTAKMAEELRTRAAAMGAKEYENTRKQAAADGAKAHEEAMRQLEAERVAIGLTGEALIAYEYQQRLINAQLAAGVALKDIDIAKTGEQARAYAAATTINKALDDQRKAMEANREAVKGFFTDWVNGVREGEGVFKSFERSILKALNNIIDQMINNMLNQMLGIGGGGMGGMGGMGGGLASGIGGILGTMLGKGIVSIVGKLFADGGAFGTAQQYALGGMFDQAQRFAAGDSFTNQVVNTPTFFRFAKGSKLGQMGEAGPEAIMPLKRGPNGALGVQAHGGGGRPVIKMGDVHLHNSFAGAIGLDSIVAMNQQAAEGAVKHIRREIGSILAEYDANGAIVS